MTKDWCPRCRAYMDTVKHEYPLLLQAEYRCIKCEMTLRVVHQAIPTTKFKIPKSPDWSGVR